MASVTFDAATRVYPGSEHPSVDAVTFNIADGEFLSLLGPHGAGKSTALRMLAGLEEVTAGRILLDGHDIDTIPPHDRDVAMAFQNYALYPHMSVADNMGFALRVAGIPAKEIDRRVRHAAEILNLTDQLNALPDQLSGHGARQLVALGRAVVREPRVFMMDDPLANLDADLRLDTGHHIAELQQRLGITTLFATSSPTEAEAFGNRIAVLNHGRLEQIGPPEDIINTPASIFVALYAAPEPMNLFLAPINGNHATLGSSTIPIPDHIRHHLTDTIVLGARPGHTTISPDNTGCPTHIDTGDV
ncbi:ABC transporter ATP-binding protein, partial [Dermatophilus congolensis]|uniref:ABC transporter ATP-binding protein n=1 Tax=Dermatophilus congolensis TaxID=1863 RepID=UPI001AB03115